MKPFPTAKSASVMAPVIAGALLSITLLSFASAVSAQTPVGPGARGPHMGGQQMGEQHMRGAQMGGDIGLVAPHQTGIQDYRQ